MKKKKWRGPLRANGRRDRESKDKGSGTARARRDKEAGDDGRALAAGPLSDRVTD